MHWSGLKKADIEEELNTFVSTNYYFEFNNEKYYYTEKMNDMSKYKINDYIALGKFDPLLISYKNKEWILGEHDSKVIWKEAGQIEGIIISNKGIVATWHYTLKSSKVIFNVKLLENDIKESKIEKALKSIAIFLKRKDFEINYV